MRHFTSLFAVFPLIVCLAGCTTKTLTFQVVDADTGKPIKGVYVGQRNLKTLANDPERVLWFTDTWHPFRTGEDGVVVCRFLDNIHWHVFSFCMCDEYWDKYATLPPAQNEVLVGQWPREGKSMGLDGVIVVALEPAHRQRETENAGAGAQATTQSSTVQQK
jgi:hypothetical protein